MRILLAGLLGLAAFAAPAVVPPGAPLAPAAARAQRPITKSEIRTAPPEQTHRRVRDQLWALIEKEDMRRERAPTTRLRRIFTRTAPRGTEIPGLCRSDELVIEFHPTGRRERGADTPVRASGFTARSRFRFLRPPTGRASDSANYRRLPGDEPGCARLEREWFFQAEDAESAADGWLAFLGLQQALRENAAVPLDCALNPIERLDCRALILSWGQDSLLGIERCSSLPDGRWCTRLLLDDRMVEIHMSAGGASVPFGTVTGARLVSMIVTSHEVID